MRVLTPSEMRVADQNAIDLGIPELVLMEQAAHAAFISLKTNWPNINNNRLLIFCGKGNNGADGLALARILQSHSMTCRIIISNLSENSDSSFSKQLKIIQKLNIPYVLQADTQKREEMISQSDIIIDALFGTGLSRPLQGWDKESIELINISGKAIFSIDIPSGISGFDGKIMGSAIKADATICLGLPKKGNFFVPGVFHCGKQYYSNISLPSACYSTTESQCYLNTPPPLSLLDPMGYKGSFGKVLILGGGKQYYGAPIFAAQAALLAGAGYVTLAIPGSHTMIAAMKCPEAVLAPLEEDMDGSISLNNKEMILSLAEKHDSVLIGPGLGRSEYTLQLVRELIPSITKALILDADALHGLAQKPELTCKRSHPTYLTPHKGEGQTLSMSGERNIHSDYQSYTLYKGPYSRIVSPLGCEWINLTGNEALGTAGSGDVLSGIIAAFAASDMDKSNVLQTAVLLHGLSADIGIREKKARSFTASDITHYLPDAIKEYSDNYEVLNSTYFDKLKTIY